MNKTGRVVSLFVSLFDREEYLSQSPQRQTSGVAGYSPWGCKELNTTKHTHTDTHICTHAGVIENNSSIVVFTFPVDEGYPREPTSFSPTRGVREKRVRWTSTQNSKLAVPEEKGLNQLAS